MAEKAGSKVANDAETKTPNKSSDYKSYIIIGAIAVVVVAALLVFIVTHRKTAPSSNPVIASYQKKLPDLKKAAADKPDDAATRVAYAQALYVTGDKKTALAEYQAAAKLSPNDATIQNNIGNTERDLKDYSAAEAAYRKAISIKPTNQNAYVNLANMQIYTQKNPGAGITTYQLAIKNIGDTPQFELLLGLAYEQDGQKTKAIETYKSILVSDPGNQAAKDNLKRLGQSA